MARLDRPLLTVNLPVDFTENQANGLKLDIQLIRESELRANGANVHRIRQFSTMMIIAFEANRINGGNVAAKKLYQDAETGLMNLVLEMKQETDANLYRQHRDFQCGYSLTSHLIVIAIVGILITLNFTWWKPAMNAKSNLTNVATNFTDANLASQIKDINGH